MPSDSPRASQRRAAKERQTKRRGELSELAFTYKAARMGFGVAKPYGDSERYDFILDSGSKLWRVQIKSTTTLLNGRYHVNSHRRACGIVLPYSPAEVDILVAYIIPEDTWYLLPIEDIRGENQPAVLLPRRPTRPRPLRQIPRSLALAGRDKGLAADLRRSARIKT